jgi:hypothetical protein
MEGIIRKIIVGPNPKDAMAYYIGMRAGVSTVCAIILDDQFLHRYGRSRYLIYIEDRDNQTLWKAIDGLPCMLEFDCNF